MKINKRKLKNKARTIKRGAWLAVDIAATITAAAALLAYNAAKIAHNCAKNKGGAK